MPDEKPDAPAPEDPNAMAKGAPRCPGAREGETIAEYRARSLAQLARGREKSKRTLAAKKKAREIKKRLDEMRATQRRMAEEERLAEEIALLSRRAASKTDLADDTIWVYDNVDAKEAEWVGAPSRGARSMLAHVRKDPANRERFYNIHVPKAMAMQEAREKEEREKREKETAEQEAEEKRKKAEEEVPDVSLAEVEQLLRQCAGAQHESLEGPEDEREGVGNQRDVAGCDSNGGGGIKVAGDSVATDSGDPGLQAVP